VWELLGWAHYNRAAICGQGGTGYAEALAVANRALELSPQFDDVELLKVAVLVETGRIEEAYAYLQATGLRAGRSANLSYGRAYALTYAGYLGEASRALDVVTRLDPLFLTDNGWAPNTLLHGGDVDGFLRLLPGTETAYFDLYRGLARLVRGEREAARRAVSGSLDSNSDDVFARLALALNSILSGRQWDGRTRVLALARHRDALGSRDGEITYKQALLLALAGDHARAIAELDRAVRQGFFAWPAWTAAPSSIRSALRPTTNGSGPRRARDTRRLAAASASAPSDQVAREFTKSCVACRADARQVRAKAGEPDVRQLEPDCALAALARESALCRVRAS
jgi:tetratricopeptide (TPR) repeat protein